MTVAIGDIMTATLTLPLLGFANVFPRFGKGWSAPPNPIPARIIPPVPARSCDRFISCTSRVDYYEIPLQF
jgi:hypothetical protein